MDGLVSSSNKLTRFQMDIVFNTQIMVCKNCWHRAKSLEQAEIHLKETKHDGFHNKRPWELPWTGYKQGKFD